MSGKGGKSLEIAHHCSAYLFTKYYSTLSTVLRFYAECNEFIITTPRDFFVVHRFFLDCIYLHYLCTGMPRP